MAGYCPWQAPRPRSGTAACWAAAAVALTHGVSQTRQRGRFMTTIGYARVCTTDQDLSILGRRSGAMSSLRRAQRHDHARA
jgi:hypothetical protein